MYKITYLFAAFIVFSLSYFTSCNNDEFPPEYIPSDSIVGIFGSVILYNEYGEAYEDNSNVTVNAHWVDSSNSGSSSESTVVAEGWESAVTNEEGAYALRDVPSGYYFITYSADGFNDNKVYAHYFDFTQADTLDLIKLAMPPKGEISLVSVVPDKTKKLYTISRILKFTGSSDKEYGIVSRYFFNNSPTVSDSDYLFTYVSGASVHKGGTTDTLSFNISALHLYNAGIDTLAQVYVRAYLDNYHYTEYQINEDESVFPNLTSPSNTISFVLDTIPGNE